MFFETSSFCVAFVYRHILHIWKLWKFVFISKTTFGKILFYCIDSENQLAEMFLHIGNLVDEIHFKAI